MRNAICWTTVCLLAAPACAQQGPSAGSTARVTAPRAVTPGADDGLIASPEPGWPQWRGPRRDGISDEKGLLASWPEGGPKLLWKIQKALVNPPKYNPILIKHQIEAVLEADESPEGPFVDSVYYNDPRTWDKAGKVQFKPGHGGHYHANILPPGATPSPKQTRPETRPEVPDEN